MSGSQCLNLFVGIRIMIIRQNFTVLAPFWTFLFGWIRWRNQRKTKQGSMSLNQYHEKCSGILFSKTFFVDIRILCRELCHKTNFSSRKIKEQYEEFNRHFPIGTIEKNDIEGPILTLLPEKYCYTIRYRMQQQPANQNSLFYFSKMIIEEFGDIQNSSLDFRQYIVGISKNIKTLLWLFINISLFIACHKMSKWTIEKKLSWIFGIFDM